MGAFELALPTNTHFSKDTEIGPRIYKLLRLGDHVSVQASVAFAYQIGPRQGGSESMEYSVVFGYDIGREDLPIPGVTSFIPLFELVGENGFAGAVSGDNPRVRHSGFRVNMISQFGFQPRIGLGYEFPMNRAGRDEMRWGVLLSWVFEL